MNPPYSFNLINLVESSYSPSGVIKRNNAAFRLYFRYLYEKALSIFKFTLPPTVGVELFKNTLFANGYVTFIETAEFGVLAQWGYGGGYTVNYAPRFILFANPLLPNLSGRELVIGEDCEVVRLTDDWRGITDLVGFYAEKMALAAQSVDVNLINSKLAYIFAAKDEAQAKSFKKMMDKINDGEAAVVVNKSLFNDDGTANWNAFQQKPKDVYIVNQLLTDLARIEDEYDTRIGIPNANTEKRERLISDEVNANNVETAILAEEWIENIRAGFDRVNAKFGTNCRVDWRFKPNVTEQSYTDNSRIDGV